MENKTKKLKVDYVAIIREFIFMSKNLRTMKILYCGRRRFELTKIRLDDEKIFLPVFDEQRSCYKICWSDFVAFTEGVQVTKLRIKEDAA